MLLTMDGITIRALCELWNEKFNSARIDKIHQPADRDIVLTVRGQSGTSRLILSANHQHPRAHELTITKPVNPTEPKMFCMMLRKRLESGRIVCVRQQGWDRVIEIVIENYNEIGDRERYALVLEIMGKHSNLLFCTMNGEGNPERILDSVVHVTPDMSRVRTVLPGLPYALPPAQDKVSPLTVLAHDLTDFQSDKEDGALARWLCTKIAGLGPVTAKEAIYRAMATGSRSAESVSQEIRTLYQSVCDHEDRTASIGLDDLGRPHVAVPYDLQSYPNRKIGQNISVALDELYHELTTRKKPVNNARDIEMSLRESIDKLTGKLTNLRTQFEESQNHEWYRIRGELLTTYSYMVKKGALEAELPNYYQNDEVEVIALDPALTPIENAQRYFKQASKRKRAATILSDDISQVEQDLKYLEDVLVHLQDADANNLDDIRRELVSQGFVRPTPKRKAQKNQTSKPAKPDVYASSDGTLIYVGRNNTQNDRLTLKSSKPEHVWLHVVDIPGSHVVIAEDASKVSSDTLHEAALLAAFFSKGRDSSNVAVDYTLIKNVWKPAGARPGNVLYDSQKTLYATPNRQLVDQIIARKAKSPTDSE